MKTSQNVITDFQELSLEEKQVVFDFVVSSEEDIFKVTYYSDEDMAKIDHDIEEAERGENVEFFSSMDEARKSLGLT